MPVSPAGPSGQPGPNPYKPPAARLGPPADLGLRGDAAPESSCLGQMGPTAAIMGACLATFGAASLLVGFVTFQGIDGEESDPVRVGLTVLLAIVPTAIVGMAAARRFRPWLRVEPPRGGDGSGPR